MAIVLPKLSRRRSPSGLAAESQPALRLSLCEQGGVYRAGESLKASWRISRVAIEDLQGLEISVLWHTEGKGDEDLHVHHFQRINEQRLREIGIDSEQELQCVLPVTPLSYHGQIVRLAWCVRLRLFLSDGREVLSEHPFYLVSEQYQHPCEASGESPEAESQITKSEPDQSVSTRAKQTRSVLASLGR